MNCEEALHLLYDIIDQEASVIDTEQVKAHFKKCRDCGDLYKLESSFHKFISMKLQATEPSAKLEVLKARIITNLDEIDCSDFHSGTDD
ncbi:MAG: zf-HC2 domain-containing protein [candidate division Zixibacteria bacterium]|nr:zf-HC2 domain-containing protein [candidate division Zixibacteria bacterium]